MAKNPNELDVICHVGKNNSKTLTTSAEFYVPDEKEDCPFREPALSRLDMSLIIKDSSGTEVLQFNIPAKDINELKMKTEIAVQHLMTAPKTAPVNNSGDDSDFSSSPAFTVPLMLTAFKGKTPGEVLIADPGQRDELLKGKKWLETNIAKFPANKKQVEAIDAAIALLDIGELEGKTVSTPAPSSNVLTVYKKECKHKAKKDNNGNNMVYSISITCDPSRDFPFEISVMNCFAPVITSSRGSTIVKMSDAVNVKKGSVAVSDSEWIGLVGQSYDLYQNFKTINAQKLFQRVAMNSYR